MGGNRIPLIHVSAQTLFGNGMISSKYKRLVLKLVSGSVTMVTMIVLYPEDYTILAPDGSCDLLVRESPGRPDIEYINPLMIPNVNVRFTSDNMIMCDSRDVQ